MPAKKTVTLAEIVDEVNYRNAGSYCSADVRAGWNSLCESLMMQADNYAGFGYLTSDMLIDGAKERNCDPGIIKRPMSEGGTIFPDETRRVYYLKKR